MCSLHAGKPRNVQDVRPKLAQKFAQAYNAGTRLAGQLPSGLEVSQLGSGHPAKATWAMAYHRALLFRKVLENSSDERRAQAFAALTAPYADILRS